MSPPNGSWAAKLALRRKIWVFLPKEACLRHWHLAGEGSFIPLLADARAETYVLEG
jgi:hypothetical protein